MLTDDQHAERQTLSFTNLGHIIVSQLIILKLCPIVLFFTLSLFLIKLIYIKVFSQFVGHIYMLDLCDVVNDSCDSSCRDLFDKSTCSVTFFPHEMRLYTAVDFILSHAYHLCMSLRHLLTTRDYLSIHGSFLGPRNDLYCSTHGKSCSCCIRTCSLSVHPIRMSIVTRRKIYTISSHCPT